MSVWFVTGASRGFGLELTAAALRHGEQVIASARDPRAVAAAFPDAGESLFPVRLDVTEPDQATAAVRAGVERFGRIDVLVNPDTGCSAASRRSRMPRPATCSTPMSLGSSTSREQRFPRFVSRARGTS